MSGAGAPGPLVIAHRGASAYRPENTLAAYELAIEQGADMVEIDLHATRDGEVAVAHDADLERLGGSGEIGDIDWEHLQGLDAGQGERVPSLSQVLDAFGTRIPFNLELKVSERGPYPGLEDRVVAELEGRGLLGEMLFSCFDDRVLSLLRQRAPEARLGLLVSPRASSGALERAEALLAESINPHFMLVDEPLVRSAHAAGLRVLVYTVDDPEAMRRLLDLGVDGIFTNCPDRMRALVDSPRAGAPRASRDASA